MGIRYLDRHPNGCVKFLLLQRSAILRRTDARVFSSDAVEVRGAFETVKKCHLADPRKRISEQQLRFLDPDTERYSVNVIDPFF
jgi:hypothetical protein